MRLGVLGQGDELSRIKAERALVEAEIRRLQSGGAPVPGGFVPAAQGPAGPPPLSINAPSWAPKALLVGAALLVAFMVVPGRRR